ncbi:MAG: zinc ribbon domain-containing protein [Ktedonobacteraceae bacterium]|nr:zinc ribbon domain-containing protein [Ktedonobacteraceae bacterium]
MNFWESVNRGLDKASREAARIARTQKLRSTIDGLNRQITTQRDILVNRAMDLFISGGLQQSELLLICQEITNLQQQLNQTQNELRQLQQGQGAAGTSPNVYSISPQGELPATPIPPTIPPTPAQGEGMATLPDYQSYPSSIMPPPPPGVEVAGSSPSTLPAPPPPPGVDPSTISSLDTNILQPPPPPSAIPRLCPACQAEIVPNTAYCHRCGAFIQAGNAAHLPTARSRNEVDSIEHLPTVHDNNPNNDNSPIDERGTIRAEPTTPPPSSSVEEQKANSEQKEEA